MENQEVIVRRTSAKMLSISSVKWYRTNNGESAYTFFPKSITNRTKKDTLTTDLAKKGVTCTVLSKVLAFGSTGKRVDSYIIMTPYKKFISEFFLIKVIQSNIDLSPQPTDKAS